ncbi:MAG: hypothetical protein ABSG68_16230 [Thermoguttaceae bacterium]|jgi:hypothetical protein
MPCKHLQELYEICQLHHLKLSSSDLIRIACAKCDVEEVCPSVLCEEYEARHGAMEDQRPADVEK